MQTQTLKGFQPVIVAVLHFSKAYLINKTIVNPDKGFQHVINIYYINKT
jgi:hypothetical protein